jgi:hypothetical protein
MSSFDQTTHDLGALPEGSMLRSVTAVPATMPSSEAAVRMRALTQQTAGAMTEQSRIRRPADVRDPSSDLYQRLD